MNYPNNNKILSLVNLKPFSEVYGTSKVFVVSLTSSNGFKISGQQLNLSLSRSTGGASKVYWLTTDVNGNVELPINLGIVYITRNIITAETNFFHALPAIILIFK